ncbi:MAG TPA: sigma 54-interacting transcriptional regulator [Gemmatimonadales bacterium]|jgi:DNA-binding NtrC family response regulator|nr:sigma 54-interacting transcriptional regulator [Gemmatimonadales bacterium]
MILLHVPPLVGCSAALRAALELARQFAPLCHPVLVIGPTGVGKSTLARILHEWSGRAGDFVSVAGGELVDSLFHNQLFGHEKGSYTGATDQAPGVFERAAGGTLLLDELQHWSRDKQAAILSPLQDARVTRVGGRRAIPTTCRVILASTIELERLVQDERLLPDLRYRIGELVIELPPLAQRRVDIPALAYRALDRERDAGGAATPVQFDPEALERLLAYEWPGNVRELERVVQYAVVRATGHERIDVKHLPVRVATAQGRQGWTTLNGAERNEMVTWALSRSRGGRKVAAALLGVHPNTIDNHRRRTVPSQPAMASPLFEAPCVVTREKSDNDGHKRQTKTTGARGAGVSPCDTAPVRSLSPRSETV